MANTGENGQCVVYYNNDKCFLVLVSYMVGMFNLFFLQKAENNKFKKSRLAKNFYNYVFVFA